MDASIDIVFAASGLVLIALIAAAAGERIGAPLLLVFLAVGVLAGSEGLDLVALDDPGAAFTVAATALAIILLDGGLRTRPETLKLGLRPGLSLATLGVFITTGVVALAARVALDIGWPEALLIGAVVSSTDAAAVFSLLGRNGVPVRPRIAATLETESGLNDPAAVFLTLSLAGALANNETGSVFGLTLNFVWQGVGGLAAGAVTGWILAKAKPRLRLAPGLRPILTLAGGVFGFALAQGIGASGFLAAYVCGLIEARGNRGVVESEAKALDGFAWLAQLILFLTLGLLASPSHIAAILIPAIAVGAALIFVARPLAVMLVLAPFKFAFAERVFTSWVGLRGATPVFLGLAPVALGAPNANLYFSVAFVIVGMSLVIQGWTTPIAARWLGVTEDDDASPPKLGPMRLTAIATALASATIAIAVTARIAAPIAPPAIAPASVLELETALAAPNPPQVTRLPLDWQDIADTERRKRLFINTVAPLARVNNSDIRAERAEVQAFIRTEAEGRELTLREQARRDVLARQYDVDYDELDELLRRVDVTPPSLVVAQAALTTGWGASPAALQQNALFGRAPDIQDDGEARFETLSRSVDDYMHTLNTHPAFAEFRQARARARRADEPILGPELVGYLGPFAADQQALVTGVQRIIDNENLTRLDVMNSPG